MEEFRSTEILDREIQDDARRKAEKLLKRADTDGQMLLDDMQTRIESIRTEKKELYSKRIESYKNDLEASLPLEKKRFLVSFEDSAVTAAIQEYIELLSSAQKLELLGKLLERYKDILESKKVTVIYTGFTEKDLKALIRSTVGKTEVISCTKDATDGAKALGMIIETEDKLLLFRITIEELVIELIDTNRFELANTLFGGRLEQ